jgi:hypothetical protein
MDHGHSKGDDAENPGGSGPDSGPDKTAAEHVAAGAEPPSDDDAEIAGSANSETPEAAKAADSEATGEGAPASKPAPRWKRWGEALQPRVAAVIGAVIVALAVAWGVFYLGPHTTTASTAAQPIGNPGHPPGHQDVSTMKQGQRFYAVPNFYYFHSCGRPCWIPLFQLPTQQSEYVTQEWPCEYYDPTSAASGGTCLQPPSGRKSSEMANAAMKDSGDRVLVVCQVTKISPGKPSQTVRNEVGQSSDIWDMVAVPISQASRNNAAAAPLTPVPGMSGFYEAYGPDIWLGNTGWHDIPCV